MRSAAHQVLHPRLPLVEQRLLAGAERVVHLLALGRQLAEELVELAEPPSSSSSWTSSRASCSSHFSGVSHWASADATVCANSLNCAPNSALPSRVSSCLRTL
jgi:hypothetical protein